MSNFVKESSSNLSSVKSPKESKKSKQAKRVEIAKSKEVARLKKKRRKEVRNKLILGSIGLVLVVGMVLPYVAGFF